MSEKPIGVGDLVMVVRWPHEHIQHSVTGNTFPKVFTVVGMAPWASHCPNCQHKFPGPSAFYNETNALPVAWLKRIDPDEKLEDVKREEEIHA